MDTYRVALFGHREISSYKIIEERLIKIIDDLIRKNSYVEFYIGWNGEFDILAASFIKSVQNRLGKKNSELILVLPYQQKDMEYYERYYDSVIIPEHLWNIHPKQAIAKRNEWIVDRCDLVICYVERKSGGAYTALKYAISLDKCAVNLFEEEKNKATV